MTELHPALELYREQLRDAVAADLRRPERLPARERAGRLAIAVAAAAAVTTVVLFSAGGGDRVQPADAAILRHVAAALSPPAGTILFERAQVSLDGAPPQLFELWQQTDPPYGYRIVKWGHEGTGTSRTPDDPAVTLRALAQSGRAHVEQVTFDGIPAYRLTVSATTSRFVNGTSYVARRNYRPLEIDTSGGGGEVIRYQAYSYLPQTASNLKLLHLGGRG